VYDDAEVVMGSVAFNDFFDVTDDAGWEDPAAAAREKSSSAYLSVISQQTFIGCWKLNAELSSLLGVSLDQLQNSAPVKVSCIYDVLSRTKLLSLLIVIIS